MSSQAQPSVREYSIRVPKNSKKRYHVMRFNGNLDVDIGKWTQVKMERENNMREYKGIEEEQPKFGAGSEFGREAKEEARRKKLGIIAKKYKVDDQPWILKTYGSTVKKFKGIREGGVSENTAYYVFTHAEDGAIEAFPLQEWYKFQPIQRYKSLTAEEAEQEYSKRNKHMNFFSLMLRKRLKGDEETEMDEEEKGKKPSKSKELKISEMDEWMNSSDDDSSDNDEVKEEEGEDKKDNKKKVKGKKNAPKKKKRDTDKEAFEDSDDGDGEGRELDYISDSTDSEPENTNLDSVAEEKGLKKLLNSDEEDEDSDKSDKEMSNEEEDKEKDGDNQSEDKGDKDKKKKKKNSKKEVKKEGKKEESLSDFSSDSSSEDESKKKPGDKKAKKEDVNSENSSRSATPTDNKRKIINDALAGPANKKMKLDLNSIPGSSESGITEEAVRKYLMRKPMTTTELLQKFKSKKTGLSSEQLVNIMTQILKRINPVKQMLKGKMYLSIKPN
ncbi:general transcription factor IIF subunit 1 [Coccinella septempunctata]|uniref:general transcription factor IIF subunit 1 n=1 Tax=Coccinella septempunctata TaxID=41139 RepID=UPI001D0831D5|nr:general transcription factor IIF subunit 1 [Coccinella septempunctata]